MLQYEINNARSSYPIYSDDDPRKAQMIEKYIHDMFMPLLRKHFPRHYLLDFRIDRYQAYLDCYSQTHPYYLHFGITRFYTTITHYSIGPVLLENYQNILGSAAPIQIQRHLLLGPDLWFTQKPWCRNLPNEENLLSLASGAYMLGMCQLLSQWPFLCHHEKFVVLFRTKAEIGECLLQVNLELKRLGLELNPESFRSGQINPKEFSFLGIQVKCGASVVFEKEDEVPEQRSSWIKDLREWIYARTAM